MTEPVEPWPNRLKTSAARLRDTSRLLETALLDEHRFRVLTGQGPLSEEAAAEFRGFNQLLITALTALIDLTAYDNPDQEYPDLEQWFEFKCPNVVYGRRTDTFRSS